MPTARETILAALHARLSALPAIALRGDVLPEWVSTAGLLIWITPGEREPRTGLRLRFIYRRRGPSLLVAEGRLNTKGRTVASRSKTGRGLVTAPIFLLVPQVKLPKRLDLACDAERAVDGVPGLIVAKWVEAR